MKSFLFKTVSFLMAFLVLFSTFSFTVEKHYCGDFLVDVSYFGDADGCGMKMDGVTSLKKKCCKDEITKIEGQNKLQKQFLEKITFKQQQFLFNFVVSCSTVFNLKTLHKNKYKYLYPPDIYQNYQVLHQTFLI